MSQQNPADPANPSQVVPQENPQESPQEQKEAKVSLEELSGRVVVAEQVVSELLKGFNMAGHAINRLESFTFVLVDLILKNNIASIGDIRELQLKLQGFEDLNDFWGVEAPAEEPDETEEETDDQVSPSSGAEQGV